MYLHKCSMMLTTALFLIAASTTVSATPVSIDFQYKLANFSGIVPYLWAKIVTDEVNNDVYVFDSRERDVRIFGETGMEIFRFGEEGELSSITDFAVDEEGFFYFLLPRYGNVLIKRCNFRGEHESNIRLQGVPEEYKGFVPEYMKYNKGNFYLVDTEKLIIMVTDHEGRFNKGYDIVNLFNIDDLDERTLRQVKRRHDPSIINDITGFSVDNRGNMYFTMATLFTAARLTPEGTLQLFGTSGSTPGKFGVVGAIAADDMGNIYVADKLRSAVIVFDKQFNFLTEFGFRGPRAENLIVPGDVEVSRNGKIYVSQAAFKGVSVFNVSLGRNAR